jgi:hypothetical protein
MNHLLISGEEILKNASAFSRLFFSLEIRYNVDIIRLRRTIASAGSCGQFPPEMRCQTLKYTKYSSGFPPFSDANFLRNPSLPNDTVQP